LLWPIGREGSAAREDGAVLHLRLIVPPTLTDLVVEQLVTTPGVVHIVRGSGSAMHPEGDVVLCDVAREAANDVIERLQDHGVHREGAIMVEAVEVAISDAAAAAEFTSPGEGGDALVWEHIEARTRDEATLTVSFLVFMAIAATIAAVGIRPFASRPAATRSAARHRPTSRRCTAWLCVRSGSTATRSPTHAMSAI